MEKRLLENNEILRKTFLFNEFVNIVDREEKCDASNYNVYRLKMRMRKTYPQLVFHMPSRRVLGELVFSENISVGEIAEESIRKHAGTDFYDIESE